MLLLPKFEDITYLKSGSPVQQKAYSILQTSKILYHLRSFRPVLTGTLPLDIFIEGKSDLDIICQARDFGTVEKILLKQYGHVPGFTILEKRIRERASLICRFTLDNFPFEIFCQHAAVTDQWAYRHMVVEYRLLLAGGEELKSTIRELKQKGMKTEPAFAFALQLQGDPYEALLRLEHDAPEP